MELNFSEEDLKEIILVSYHYFYNPGDPRKYSTELNVTSHNLRDRIVQENPNSLMESGIITILSYFLDSEFIVRCDPFPVNLPPFVNPIPNNVIPAMPMNWRNNVNIYANISYAEYFIRQQNQVFTVNVFYTFRDRKVGVNVRHITVNHEPLTVEFREADLLALSDPQHALAFAIHCINDCSKKFTKIVTKAALDLAPSSRRTPVGITNRSEQTKSKYYLEKLGKDEETEKPSPQTTPCVLIPIKHGLREVFCCRKPLCGIAYSNESSRKRHESKKVVVPGYATARPHLSMQVWFTEMNQLLLNEIPPPKHQPLKNQDFDDLKDYFEEDGDTDDGDDSDDSSETDLDREDEPETCKIKNKNNEDIDYSPTGIILETVESPRESSNDADNETPDSGPSTSGVKKAAPLPLEKEKRPPQPKRILAFKKAK